MATSLNGIIYIFVSFWFPGSVGGGVASGEMNRTIQQFLGSFARETFGTPRDFSLLSRSSLEPLISLDLVGTKVYCFRDRVHCHHCLYIIFATNPVKLSEELRGGPF